MSLKNIELYSRSLTIISKHLYWMRFTGTLVGTQYHWPILRPLHQYSIHIVSTITTNCVPVMICDKLSKNPTCLHNSVCHEIHWVKILAINNFTHVLIASVNSEGRLELNNLIYQWFHLFMESMNSFCNMKQMQVMLSVTCVWLQCSKAVITLL